MSFPKPSAERSDVLKYAEMTEWNKNDTALTVNQFG